MSEHNDYVDGVRNATVVEAAEFNLVALLKPSVMIDGNQWCVLYGANLQEGIAGFGDTPYLAVLAFNKEWHRTLPTKDQGHV